MTFIVIFYCELDKIWVIGNCNGHFSKYLTLNKLKVFRDNNWWIKINEDNNLLQF